MDTKQLLTILEKFTESGIEELKFKDESSEIVLKKSQKISFSSSAAPSAAAPQLSAPLGQNTRDEASPTQEKAASSPGTETIDSPIVGSFYRSPAPDAPVFADEGQEVKKGQPLCIIEAMKVMNQLEAEFDCTIVKILVDNGQMVEYGTPIFEVIRQ